MDEVLVREMKPNGAISQARVECIEHLDGLPSIHAPSFLQTFMSQSSDETSFRLQIPRSEGLVCDPNRQQRSVFPSSVDLPFPTNRFSSITIYVS